MNVKVFFIMLLSTLILVGCVKTVPFQSIEPGHDDVLVYVFRPESPLSRGIILQLNVNGENMGQLLNNAYLPVIAKPGNIEIELRQPSFPRSQYDSINIMSAEAGETYFVKAKPGVFGAFSLVEFDEQQGKSEIRSTELYQQ